MNLHTPNNSYIQPGFTTGTDYQSTITTGPSGQQWKFYYGTPTTTDAITGTISVQMRWYTTATSNLGYAQTEFNLSKVTKVTFNAKSTNNLRLNVLISNDNGSTWVASEQFTLTTTATLYTYNIPALYQNDNIRVRFSLTYSTAPASTSRLTIDDVSVYGLVLNP